MLNENTDECTVTSYFSDSTGLFRLFASEIYPDVLKTFSAKFYRVSILGDGGRWQVMPVGTAESKANRQPGQRNPDRGAR
jgi:hypothetical protein